MSIQLPIPLENTFNLEEGQYRGRLHSITRKVRRSTKTPEEQVRFLFEVFVPSINNRIPMAGRTFTLTLKAGSELRSFLEDWLGVKFFLNVPGRTLELDSLIGREGDLILVHIHNTGYENPLVFIEAAYPPGTLTLTEEPEESGDGD